MLDGWYYRSLAKEEQPTQEEPIGGKPMESMEYESRSDEENQEIDASDQNVSSSNKAVDYKSQFRFLKRKLKFLIYENEFFQDALRSNQRRLLKVSRDRAFLLDRLLQYEKPENTSSESEETDSSEEETKDTKKRKAQESFKNENQNESSRGRKKLFKLDSTVENLNETELNTIQLEHENNSPLSLGAELEIEDEQQGQGHMSAAEVERHLKSKKNIIDLLPERAPATVPTEMFSIDQTVDITQ